MSDEKMMQVVGDAKRKMKKSVKWWRSTPFRIVLVVMYVELCFCAGYILAHKDSLQKGDIQKVRIYAQTQASQSKYSHKGY